MKNIGKIVFCIVGVLILAIPISTAIDMDKNVNDEAGDNPEIKSLDVDNEFFTQINTLCTNVVVNKNGFIKDIEFTTEKDPMYISGLLKPIIKEGELNTYQGNPQYIHAPFFIGKFQDIDEGNIVIAGFAFGDIDWS
jgi:hypothetical protein